ncbi:CBS domain-containing protein [Candidatus Bathyarchaeota archaeon]|jgi:signal-transduction protein with cAMP-binding, CBS, and nucleotidyltransferase domain|nr:MAG: CBS domain-containing protein [Candidatus Bathyarchaeota archaeon]
MKLRIEDVIIRKVITIDSEASSQDATNKMKQYSTSCLVVLSENRIDGILTTRDLITRVVARGLEPGKVRVTDIATRPVIMMRPETPLEEAIKIMLQRKIKKIPLISGDKDNARLYGLLSLTDIIEYHSEIFSTLWEQLIMTVPAAGIEGVFTIA